jgi:hypothetical protein
VLVRSRSSVRRVLIGVFVLTLVHATRLHAQSILDAQRVQFTPSADNNTLGGDGTPVVSNYTACHTRPSWRP